MVQEYQEKTHLFSTVQEYLEEIPPVQYGKRIQGGNPTCPVWYKNTRMKPRLSGMVTNNKTHMLPKQGFDQSGCDVDCYCIRGSNPHKHH
ncbi:hypothetical protein DPMN_107764 [Dreissena polymorpha]|uniref:Uncharacterized protein n=1 Tax=Dreissena polymorpha TaxID=45954 RepID=A0A9D4K7N0_DREPO|nr:hypothetical protein DPMN_107764 [Dreissena polymorpha]